MEIFQTIWTALTTENKIMLNIIIIPLSFLEATVSTLLFSTILNIKSSKKCKLIYILTFSCISLLSAYIIPTPYNTYFNLIICPILVLFIFKTNILKAILSEVIPYVFFILIGSLLISIYMKILNVNSNYDLMNIPIHKLYIL